MSDPLVPYFQEFLKRISLTTNQRRELIKNHSTLRERLQQDCELAPQIKEIFLQGSYKRDTIVRHKDGKYSDVDIVVVMNLDKNKFSPDEVLQIFKPFLRRYYKGWCRRQTHSWGIKLSNVHVDVIPAVTSPILHTNIFLGDTASSWKSRPLYIPNRRENKWQQTDPLQIIRWTKEKNERCNGYYTDVVKCIKWWRRVQSPNAKRLKGYPLEYLVAQCCPDGITSVEEGVMKTLNKMVTYPRNCSGFFGIKLPCYNVFSEMSDKEYNEYYNYLCEAAHIARQAYTVQNVKQAVGLWRELLGGKFSE